MLYIHLYILMKIYFTCKICVGDISPLASVAKDTICSGKKYWREDTGYIIPKAMLEKDSTMTITVIYNKSSLNQCVENSPKVLLQMPLPGLHHQVYEWEAKSRAQRVANTLRWWKHPQERATYLTLLNTAPKLTMCLLPYLFPASCNYSSSY